MPRPLKYSPGQQFSNGKITVLEVISQGASKRAKVKIHCSYCDKEKVIASGHLHKMISRGCMKHESSIWRSVGPKNKSWQLPPGEAAFNQLYYSYANRADRRGLDFMLSKEEFKAICTKNCVYCGSGLQTISKGLGKTSGNFAYTGIDRIYNEIGYINGNCVPCCSTCNWMKHKMSHDKFLEHISRISRHQAIFPFKT
jgi:hypothetical protein